MKYKAFQIPSSKSRDRAGQIIVEVGVALGILTVGYLSILALLNRSLGTSNIVNDQNIATYLAAEGIEITKNLVDAELAIGVHFPDPGFRFQRAAYEVFYDSKLDSDLPVGDPEKDGFDPGRRIGNYNDYSNNLLRFDANPVSFGYNYNSGTETKFKRTIKLDFLAGSANKVMHIFSVVRWDTKGGGSSEVRLEDYFFDNQ